MTHIHQSQLLALAALEMEEAIVVHSSNGAIQEWNKGAEKLFGHPRDAAQALHMAAIISSAAWTSYQQHVADLLRGGSSGETETQGATREGHHVDLLLKLSLFSSAEGGPPLVIAIFRDISARKAAEDRLVALIESTPDPFIIVEGNGDIQRVNRQAEILFGYQRSELIGRSFKMLVPARFRPQHDVYTRDYQVKPVMRQMGSGLELCCLTRSGEEIPVEIGLSPVVSRNETTIMIRFRDVREQRREKALLQQALQHADEANRAKSRFLAAASHDLRQPLQSISMNLGVLAGELGKVQRDHVIAQTRMALDTTNQLLNSLLDITRLESGKIQPEIGTFYVREVLERVYNTERQQACEKKHRFSLRSCSLAATCDPALLEQMLTNLVANAIRYTPPHGHIVLGCRRLGSSIRIEVLDNGPGIAAEALDLIFDEYRQLEQTRNYEGMNLGLGLSIVKLLAELLHLKLEVRSVPGRGSCFCVVVPVAFDVPRAAPVRANTPTTRNKPAGVVLLIDDDEAVLDSTSLFLEISGFHTVSARSSEEVFARLTAIPDLIITDYGLGQKETGIDLLRKIRERLNKDIPAIVVTGDTSLQRRDDIIGKARIVCKPIDPEALLQLAREQISHSSI